MVNNIFLRFMLIDVVKSIYLFGILVILFCFCDLILFVVLECFDFFFDRDFVFVDVVSVFS